MSAGEIVWEEPPGIIGRGNPGKWVGRLTPLMEHPKRWASLGYYNPSMASKLSSSTRGRGIYAVPPGRWEFVGRRPDGAPKGKVTLYARYLGPEGEAS